MTDPIAHRLALADRFRALATPDVADGLDRLGHREQTAEGIVRMWDDCSRIAGRVMPILLGPEFTYSTTIGTLEAIAECEPGDVLVFANGGRPGLNSFGSIAALCAERAGIVGTVIDGVTRDLDDMRAQTFPLFARGVTTTTVRERTGFGGFGKPIRCSGIDVASGDWVVADGSGTIFIPGDDVEEVLVGAENARSYERALRQRILQGEDPVQAHQAMRYDQYGTPS